MILMYHKIHPDTPTMWWVSVDEFYRQLCELRGKDVVYLDDYDPQDPNQVVITFDGVYQNVVDFALPLLKKFEYPFELFIAGDHVGKDNGFDSVDKRTGEETGEPLSYFADSAGLKKLVEGGGRLQWHSRSHPNLTTLSKSEIQKELKVPQKFKKLDPNGFTWFAYPHGEFNDEVIKETRDNFSGGLSVIQGNDTDSYVLNRLTVVNDTMLSDTTIGVAIPCYNYGSYLVEAIQSVLNQTRPVDKILIIDDGSSDNTQEIARVYVERYKHIEFIRHEKNRGIIPTFNRAIKTLNTDYVCLLGADNRFMSNYIEEATRVLDSDESVGIAYTDFALFGPLASSMFSRFPKDHRGESIDHKIYPVHFPEFTPERAKKIEKANFIHGSSVYRKSIFDAVGGYKESKTAEDHDLFTRIIKTGWAAGKAQNTFLEYRQHSRTQVNAQLISQDELLFYRSQIPPLRQELEQIKSSKFWKLLNLYKNPKTASKMYAARFITKVYHKILNKLKVD